MNDLSCKLLVIGAGPGGYVCAIRAGQLGIDTVIVERQKLGGACLNVGCIPSKALIHTADEFHKFQLIAGGSEVGISASKPSIDLAKTVEWKNGIVSRLNNGVGHLLKKSKVTLVDGEASFIDGKTVEVVTEEGNRKIRAENIVIATGSVPVELPGLPFGGSIISSTEALSLTKIPRKLAVVGGGYIGLEIGTAFAKLGSEVTVVEEASRILSQYDPELTQPVVDRLDDLGVTVLTGARAKGLSDDSKSLLVETSAGEAEEILADHILVTVGRRPLIEDCGLEELGLNMAGRFVGIDEKCRTSMRGVYAIGDVTGEPMLAHRAMAQGELVAEVVAGQNCVWDKQCIPAVCFTDPEIVTAGISLDDSKENGLEIKIGKFPFQANGRAMTTGREDGFVRVVCRADNHIVVGIHAVGEGISELSSAFSLAIEMGARLEDIAATIHAHPTKSEALQEAALNGLGHALHI